MVLVAAASCAISIDTAVELPVGSLDTIGDVPVTVFGVIRFAGVIALFTPPWSINSLSLALVDVVSSSPLVAIWGVLTHPPEIQ